MCVMGIIMSHGINDLEYWEGNLTEEEELIIRYILSRHETDGESVRGTQTEIAREIGAEEEISRSDFIEAYRDAIDKIYAAQENKVYGFPVTVHWHGVYCNCEDGVEIIEHIIPAIEDCDEALATVIQGRKAG